MKFTRDEANEAIHKILDWMDHGVTHKKTLRGDDVTYYGHPALYFRHSPTEADRFINSIMLDNS